MPKPPAATSKPVAHSQKHDAAQQKASGTLGSTASAYEEAQRDEIEVLKSIFMEDFEVMKTKSAWARNADRSFKIKVRAYTDAAISLTLAVTLTATYPKTLPLLRVEDVAAIRPVFLEQINRIISTRPRELLGEVMVHELVTTIQDVLEESASAKLRDDNLPSLEVERAKQEAEASRVAQEQEAHELKRSQEAKEEEERVLQRMLSEEVKRRQDVRPKRESEATEPGSQSTSSRTCVNFDHDVHCKDAAGFDSSFRTVSIMTKLRSGPITDVYCVCPDLPDPVSMSLVLKRATVPKSKQKKSILDLEARLELLKGIRHSNVVNLLDFRIDGEKDLWQFDILTEFANFGSLADLLGLSDTLAVSKSRSFSIELLQAIDFYHKNGVVHGDLHAGNVLFHKTLSGSMTLKLADAGFQAALRDLKSPSEANHQKHGPKSDSWITPELAANDFAEKSRKSDVWAFGVLLLEMIFGTLVTSKYKSPQAFISGAGLSEPLEDLARNVFQIDPRKRPSAFDIIPHEFFRTDVPAVAPAAAVESSTHSISAGFWPGNKRSRLDSISGPKATSRYTQEWDEAGRLGRGGYGEVVKARNKVDGRIYAIKKVTQKSQTELSQVLSEVYLLATLNHPYVVRYYTAWPEDDVPTDDDDDVEQVATSVEDVISTGDDSDSLGFGQSTGGLDFISSSGFPKIEFGDEDDDIDEEDDSSDESAKAESSSNAVNAQRRLDKHDQLILQRSRSDSRAAKFTLYIQMEFCERHTLRDMIRKGMQENMDHVWQILRQILEGLAHIHAHGIIHRDLKPENIFIDVGNNPKIGDFGLAKSGQYQLSDKAGSGHPASEEMTRSVGTTLYVAPEVRSNTSVSYTEKVDMFSLGVILFEMCFAIGTAMERIQVLRGLRDRDHVLPAEFSAPDRALQGEIIESLIKHKPSERPSSTELLRSGKIPVKIEDETIQLALQSLTDDSSPYYHKVMSALFSNGVNRQVRDRLWDTAEKQLIEADASNFYVFQNVVRERLTSVFRRHGAVETKRQMLFPRSDYYTTGNVVQLLDPSGTLLQLPYDLTLPHARAIARQHNVPAKSFTFGTVFRDSKSGGAPQANREVDFDIVTRENSDLALPEAETVKMMDEILDAFPSFASTHMAFHLSHCDLLEAIMEFCRIPLPQRSAVKEIIGKLNIQQWTWQRVRLELRAPSLGISATSLDELAQFDFRDSPGRCFTKLQSLFVGTSHLRRLQDVFTHISGLEEYCKRLGVRRKIYFSPLSSFNHKFYEGGIMFQCIYDAKKRDVLAAGGRYDSLVKQFRPLLTEQSSNSTARVVGINIAWDRLVSSMMRWLKSAGNSFLKKPDEVDVRDQWTTRRCDVLVASLDSSLLRSTGLNMVADLWRHDIAAELAGDAESSDELFNRHRDDKHSWIIIIRNEESVGSKPDLKIKSMDKKEDFDVRSSELISFMRSEIRDRDQREGTHERVKTYRQPSHSENVAPDKKRNVQVLTTSHKNKKSNKWRAVESAQAKAQELIQSFSDNPIASIDTRDGVLDMIRETRLSDPESWRKVVQAVPLSERQYIQEIQDMISKFKTQYEDTTRNCFIYNFRSGTCILYDMKL